MTTRVRCHPNGAAYPLWRAAMLEMPAQVMRELSAAAQVMWELSATARAATPAQPMAVLGLIRWLRAHHDERTLPDAPAAQVERVVARWRARFKVFRPHLLRAAAAVAGFAPEELLDHALAIGVLKAYDWQAKHWDELGPLPATDVDQLVRRVALQEADRYLRSAERDTEADGASVGVEDLPWMYPRPTAPDTGPPAAAVTRWRAVLAQAGPVQRRLLEAWYAQPDAMLSEIARAIGTTEEAAEQAIRRLRRRLG